jgi:hypothetical protein
MELRRRTHKNKLNNDIRDAENFISRNEETIKRIKNSNMGVEYIQNQIIKLKTAVEEKREILAVITEELLHVSNGLFDEKINDEYKHNTDKHNKSVDERKLIVESNKDEMTEKKGLSAKYWEGVIDASRAQKQQERDYKYGLKYFRKVCDQLPDYMIRNLSEMPNNKGYIWRGVHFYGDLPEQSGPVIMFEKQRGDINIIHEYTDREYRIYEKKGKDRKVLVHKEPIKRKVIEKSLMDYVK